MIGFEQHIRNMLLRVNNNAVMVGKEGFQTGGEMIKSYNIGDISSMCRNQHNEIPLFDVLCATHRIVPVGERNKNEKVFDVFLIGNYFLCVGMA